MTEDDFNEDALFSKPVASGSNPLSKYFRSPGIQVHLPTNGMFLPRGAVETTMTGEVPVYPMRAQDEMLLMSPDALMNGYAIEKLIESCVPAIKARARDLSAPDLDVLLLAIRAASFGPNMEIDARCPACDHENTFECHLPAMLRTVDSFKEEDPVVRLTDEIVVFVRPYNFGNTTYIAVETFKEIRKIQAIEDMEEGTEKQNLLNESYERLNTLNNNITSECVYQVIVPEGAVKDRKNIKEFFDNIPREFTAKIQERLKALNAKGVDRGIKAKCVKCEHEWDTEIEFNPSSFFAQGS